MRRRLPDPFPGPFLGRPSDPGPARPAAPRYDPNDLTLPPPSGDAIDDMYGSDDPPLSRGGRAAVALCWVVILASVAGAIALGLSHG